VPPSGHAMCSSPAMNSVASMRSFALVVSASSIALLVAGCPVTCIRAINCVETCGGPVLQSGCSACPAGTFDDLMCRPDSGADAPSPTADAGGGLPFHLIRHDCGPTDGPALRVGLYGGVDPACGGDPSQRSVELFVFASGTDAFPPAAGSVIRSTVAMPRGTVTECPGGTPPCRTSQDFTLTFDSYADGVDASGTYDVTFAGGETTSGSFDAMWCEREPVLCG